MAEKDFASAAMELAHIEQLDVAAMETLYRLECSGEDFYNLLADRVGNDEAADLLRKNGREELGHARRIRRAIALKLGREYEPEGEVLERFAVACPRRSVPSCCPPSCRARSPATRATRSGPTTSPTPRSHVCCA